MASLQPPAPTQTHWRTWPDAGRQGRNRRSAQLPWLQPAAFPGLTAVRRTEALPSPGSEGASLTLMAQSHVLLERGGGMTGTWAPAGTRGSASPSSCLFSPLELIGHLRSYCRAISYSPRVVMAWTPSRRHILCCVLDSGDSEKNMKYRPGKHPE